MSAKDLICQGLAWPRENFGEESPRWNVRVRAAMLVLAAIAVSTSPSAAAGLGPVSSETITISVSVAPRYAVRAEIPTASTAMHIGHPVRYCIETNSAVVPARLLLRSDLAASLPSSATAIAMLEKCSFRGPQASGLPLPAATPGGNRLIIVRPE